MGQESIVYGYLLSAGWMSQDPGRLHRLNREVIESLPTDGGPSARMFAPLDENGGRGHARKQIIHFGAVIDDVRLHWKPWLKKFEAMLKRTHWLRVVLHLDADELGEHRYEWSVEADQIIRFFQDPPLPVERWTFDGGPRDFDGW